MRAPKGLLNKIKQSVSNYKQAIGTVIVISGILFPLYLLEELKFQAAKHKDQGDVIELLDSFQTIFLRQDKEILELRNTVIQQNEIMNQMLQEIQRLRGIEQQERPPRSAT